MPTRHTSHDKELALSEMLADPIVQAVMARDDATRDEVEGLIHAVRRKLAEAWIKPGRIGRQVSAERIFAE